MMKDIYLVSLFDFYANIDEILSSITVSKLLYYCESSQKWFTCNKQGGYYYYNNEITKYKEL